MTHYVCKYTPVELLTALGADCVLLDETPERFDGVDEISHANLCGYGKTVLQACLNGGVRELVLVNCCDSIRRVYDVLLAQGDLDFLFLMDLPHGAECCGRERLARELQRLVEAYGAWRGTTLDREAFFSAFEAKPGETGPYLGLMGARMSRELRRLSEGCLPLPLRDLTCTGNRKVRPVEAQEVFWEDYAAALLEQLPCMRMTSPVGRRPLLENPDLAGIVYHTVKFCDYYGFEYAGLSRETKLPLLKLESDGTFQSAEQLRTRLEAFGETLELRSAAEGRSGTMSKSGYVAGIDSGSTSTDVVILDENRTIVASVILPTGAGAAVGAERALEAALQQANLKREDLRAVVATGYGRSAVAAGERSVTEISCHAKGAHFLYPGARTVIDIGGQDSKVIRLNEDGAVANFAMNDKCAAGTGRFLELMARTLELSLEEMGQAGLKWKEEISISSMCTVFAESEVVTLIAQNRAIPDIVHGLNDSVAVRTISLLRRLDPDPGTACMTGGVSKNLGVVRAIEARLGQPLLVSEQAQLCGALGAALFAWES